jgi:hypothetical protein
MDVERLKQVVRAAGGVTAVAYHVGRTEAAVYGWYAAGRVYRGRDAVILMRLAAARGFHVSFEELVGEAESPAPTPPPSGDGDGGRAKAKAKARDNISLDSLAHEPVHQGDEPPRAQMQIPLGRPHRAVPREIAQAPRIHSVLREMRQEAMPQGVNRALKPAPCEPVSDHPIHVRLVPRAA